MYDSAFITQFPTLYKNTQERHVSGHETWEIGSVLEEGKKREKKKEERAGVEGGLRLWGEVGVWGGKELGKRGGGVSNPTTSFQRKLSDKLGHADT